MIRAWEILRPIRYFVTKDMLVTQARRLFRDIDERVLPVVNNEREMKLEGFITWVEAIIPTSRKSSIRISEVMREFPVFTRDADIWEIYKTLIENKLWAAPVIDTLENMRVIGIVSMRDILKALIDSGLEPLAKSVGEVMTVENLDEYLITADTPVTKVWSKFVYRAQPALIIVRSKEEPIPWGIVTPKDMVTRGRWYFHRESEKGVKTVAKVKRIMTRGVLVATPDTPIEIAVDVMIKNDFTVLPVVDEKGRVIGILTQADVVRAYLEGKKPERPVVKPVPLPLPVAREERVSYVKTSEVLHQVAVAREIVPPIIGVTVSDIMEKSMSAIGINDTVEHARNEMLRKKTNYLLVIDENKNILGYVSKWSMLKAIATQGPLWKRRIRDKMFIDYVLNTSIPRVKTTDPIEKAAYTLVVNNSEVAIVEDETGNIAGFITKDTLVKAYAEKSRDAIEVLVENVMTPGRIGIVHPHYSLNHVITKMKTFYLDAIAVYDGRNIRGVVSANRLPFVAYEDSIKGIKSRRLVWVRKLVRGAARRGRYVKITPLLAIDATVPTKRVVKTTDNLKTAIETIFEENVDGLPVVNEEGVLVGVICKNDILREMARTAERRIKIEKPPTIKKIK